MQGVIDRAAGILLPISSLPSKYGIGTFGRAAYEFVDMIAEAGQKYWQVLPIGPTSYGDSPYQSYSAFAGNPYFIDLDTLIAQGLLTKEEVESHQWGDTDSYISYDRIYNGRFAILRKAYERSNHKDTDEYREFCECYGEEWLDDFVLYAACKNHFEQKAWTQWDHDIKFRVPEAMKALKAELADEMDFYRYIQYEFRRQWNQLKQYANEREIQIIGDIPLYMALDSADVWAHPDLFVLSIDLDPVVVAGCPPDAFSSDGQLWGNPIYAWEKHEIDGFSWWKARMSSNASLYDVIRIDHFIGIVRYFNIPAQDESAKNGWFLWGPGKKLTDAIDEAVGDKKIIAEDLGIVIPEVRELLAQAGYPGMKVVQFAFDSDSENEHLPFRCSEKTIAYCGTHDNETMMGYMKSHEGVIANRIRAYFDVEEDADETEFMKKLVRGMYATGAAVVILTAQDLLGKGNEARMNMPSTMGDNWKWRLAPGEMSAELLKKLELRKMACIYGRFVDE